MQRVSIRTLVLLLELLIAVVAMQYVTMVTPVQAGAVWLATDYGAPASAPAGQVDSPLGL
jgi:hypothetical protein